MILQLSRSAVTYSYACVDLTHLFGHLLDRSSGFLVFVLGHGQTEELLDAAVVRLPRRRLLLDGGPQGLTVRVCKCPKTGEMATREGDVTLNSSYEN